MDIQCDYDKIYEIYDLIYDAEDDENGNGNEEVD